jgi:hypothetical protein
VSPSNRGQRSSRLSSSTALATSSSSSGEGRRSASLGVPRALPRHICDQKSATCPGIHAGGHIFAELNFGYVPSRHRGFGPPAV